jgi:hypothetical protein
LTVLRGPRTVLCMLDDYWERTVKHWPLEGQQARFQELAKKILNMQILSKDELEELIALRQSLQQKASGISTDETKFSV